VVDGSLRVYLLWHEHDPDDDTAKLLGVYSTRERAETRIASAKLAPGFRRFPEAFTVDEYTVDKDEWIEGFVTMGVDGEWVDEPDASC
jgi:hypothetical protein